MPFRIALSGLEAASTDLQVTGNNVANAATNGFKESRAEFADLYATSIQDTSNNAAGQGVRVAKVSQQFSQGSVDFTSNNLDLAISGQGFFVLKDPDGTPSYTRAGAYSADRDGYVVNHANQRLQIYGATEGVNGESVFNTGVPTDLLLPTTPSDPTPTSDLTAALNLNASDTVPTAPTFDPTDPRTYNSSTSTTMYDSLGNAHTTTLYYRKTGPNTWDQYIYVKGRNVPPAGGTPPPAPTAADLSPPEPFSLVFNSSGALTTVGGATGTTGATHAAGIDTGSGANPLVINLNLGGMSQFGAPFAVNNLTQNGYTSGRLAGVDIDTSGVVFARYTNGQSSALGKVAMAKFTNTQGLRQQGDTNWSETFASGPPQLGEAGTSSFGQIQSGALEASNVDIAEQLVNLITAQRNFQANAEVISTADTIAQTIINIR